MCCIMMEKEAVDKPFFLTNVILSKTGEFGLEELYTQLNGDLPDITVEYLENHIYMLVNIGAVSRRGNVFWVKRHSRCLSLL